MRRKLPSTQALNCFEAAARHQSFTRAAQELNLTQGAVSRQVAVLEDFLGVPLLKRTQHGMVLTPAGADYARHVRQRLDALERDAVELMGRRGQGDSLTLAAVPTFATRWLIPRLPGLAAEQPDLLVQDELASGALVVACGRPLKAQRAYYLVQPQATERPALAVFRAWLLGHCGWRPVVT